ncbi:MAG: hypothetical protein HOK98_09640 [Rhodospirillaceae bacterium]|jgi:uncharacterized protein involved in outer membrane biogenesis|nr:hypothetical protein [Rhodospirillaceae bacterium]
MKKILIGLGVLVVIAAVGIFVFLGNLNDIVRAAVEKVGSDMTQTNVVLNEVDIELTSGKGALRGFRVTNPSGFSDDDAFKFDEVSVSIDLSSVRSDPVIIKEVIISGPEVVYEFGENGESNLDKLNKAVQSKSSGGEKSSGGGDAPNIVIESLVLQNGKVAVVAPLLTQREAFGAVADHPHQGYRQGWQGCHARRDRLSDHGCGPEGRTERSRECQDQRRSADRCGHEAGRGSRRRRHQGA